MKICHSLKPWCFLCLSPSYFSPFPASLLPLPFIPSPSPPSPLPPDDSYRVRLLLHPGVVGSDYMNASYVDVSTYNTPFSPSLHSALPPPLTFSSPHLPSPFTFLPLPFTGLPAASSVHSDPGSTETHSGRLLADGLGAQSLYHHDALSAGGEGEGRGKTLVIRDNCMHCT